MIAPSPLHPCPSAGLEGRLFLYPRSHGLIVTFLRAAVVDYYRRFYCKVAPPLLVDRGISFLIAR